MGLRLQDFSLARDVISSTLLDERDLVPDPPREIAPDPKLDPTNPPAKKRLVGKPWLVLLPRHTARPRDRARGVRRLEPAIRLIRF